MRALRNAACELADRGWYVLPIEPRSKRPLTALAPNGKDSASNDLRVVFEWWRARGDANVAVVAEPSGLVILDVDPRHGGDDDLHALQGDLGPLPATVEGLTGGSGQHLLFRHPGIPLRGRLGEGIDIKSAGYCLFPPSIHPSGGEYVWSVDGHPDDVEVASLPQAWLDKLVVDATNHRGSAATLSQDCDDPIRAIPAARYIQVLTGREPDRFGYVTCPFHGGGQERTPSLKVNSSLWSCHACQPIAGKRVMGGTCLDFAALLWGFAIPLRGVDYLEVRARAERALL